MSGLTAPIVFDFGTTFFFETSADITTPLLHAPSTVTSATGNVDVSFNWTKAQGDWSTMFKFRAMGATEDFDDVANTDISYNTYTDNWYNGNLMTGTPTGMVTGSDTTKGTVMNTASIAKDMFTKIGYDIFGVAGGLDLFSNEAAVMTSIEGINSDLDTAVDALLDASDTAGSSAVIATRTGVTNFAYQALTTILAKDKGVLLSRSQAAIDLFTADPTAVYNVPLLADDHIVFTITINPKFGGAQTAASHGIGDNPVESRKYRITLHLKN